MNRKSRSTVHAPSRRRGPFAYVMMAGIAAIFVGVTPASSTSTSSVAPECSPPAPGLPMLVTDDCVDPRFNQPYVDIDELRDTPAPHRYVHGGFTGTDARFAFYFPPAEQYQGRFIQGPTHQLTGNENLAGGQISFVLASGGYAVQTNMGGSEAATFTEAVLFFGFDPAIVGYRVNAAAAKYSRVVAGEMYGGHRPYGYLHGGSGGAYQTISSLENTTVWDGGVPFVLGSPASIPNGYTLRVHAQRILGPSGKFPCILDAYDPGGSRDPVASCDLNEEQAGAIDEATRLGFPPRAWFGASLAGAGALPLIAGYVSFLDPTYTEDFWTNPGYLGHDDPYGSLAAARTIHTTTVTEKLANPNRLRLDTFAPTGALPAIDLRIVSGAGAGVSQIGLAPGYVRAPQTNATERTVTISAFGAAIYDAVQVGDQVALDNSHFLALQTYHRHQVGTPDWDFYPWRRLFLDNDGNPIYPQRDVLTGPVGQHNGSGGDMTGIFHGKMIIQESLMDPDAHPWGADWYKRKVERVLCTKEGKNGKDKNMCKAPGQARKVARKMDNTFRVYMQDHAQHGGGGGTSTRTVSYSGALQQALRDLAKWVEQGVKPPASTRYEIVDGGQVAVPDTAAARKGIQPVLCLLADGSVRAEVAVGQPVTLTGQIQAPPRGGKVVSVEWNVEGATGGFVPVAFGNIKRTVDVETTHVFSAPGTYFPVLRATSQREGDPNTPFARIENIARVRVVVR